MPSESSQPLPVAGVVPCAGTSERMGVSKASLNARGLPFLVRAVHALADGGCVPVVVVVRDLGGEEAALAREAGAEVILNRRPEDGPIGSLRSALALLGDTVSGCAYLPVDHPLLRPATVRVLVQTFLTLPTDLVVPVHRGRRGHPPILGAALFAELADPSLTGGARTVVHRHLLDAELVDVDDPGVVADLDTPAAYREAFGVDPA